MNQYGIFLIILMVLIILDALAFAGVLKHRHDPQVKIYLGVLGCISFRALFSALSITAKSVMLTELFSRASDIFMVIFAPAWLFFSYTFIEGEVHKGLKYLLVLQPLIIGFILTNQFHHWIWFSSAYLPVGRFLIVEHGYGFLYSIQFLITTTILLYGAVYMLVNGGILRRTFGFYGTLLVVVIILVLIINTAELMGLSPLKNQISPLLYSVIVLIMTSFALYLQRFSIYLVSPRLLYQVMDDGFLVFDKSNLIVEINPKAAVLIGESVAALLGKNVNDVLPFWHTIKNKLSMKNNENRDSEQYPIVVTQNDDELIYLDVHVHLLDKATILVLRDVSAIQQLMVRVEEIASNDPLTGLRNRRSFFDSAELLLKLAKRSHQGFSLLFVDIDDFKKINDQYGHLCGDGVLKTVADLMQTTLRAVDVKARYGGDEFAIYMPQTSGADAQIVAEKLIQSIRSCNMSKYNLDQPLTVSIGLSGRDVADRDTELIHLLDEADQALGFIKKNGKNGIQHFSTMVG